MTSSVKQLKHSAIKTGGLIGLLICLTLLSTFSLFYGWSPNVKTVNCSKLEGTVSISVQILWQGRTHVYTVACPAGTVVENIN